MAILETVTAQEDFLVQVNGDYNILFDQMEVATAQKAGDIIAFTVGAGTSYGIVAKDKGAVAEVVRVMVRGNPTTVNAKSLNYGALVVADVVTALLSQDIHVIND